MANASGYQLRAPDPGLLPAIQAAGAQAVDAGRFEQD